MESLQPGATLDTFTLLKELYSGAMARLYQATDMLTDETVALKVPFGDILNNPVQFYHYQNEERIGRLLDHPAVVRFFSRNRSRQYIIMEYIAGKDLRSKVGSGKKMEFSRAGPLVLQITDALTYLHDSGIIHLDLKPENIIITPQGRVKVIDFGYATRENLPDLLAEDLPLPHGTPYYIAPEQLVGHRREKRSDIYSLGVILYEMVTGRLPHAPSTSLSTTTRQRLKNDPVPPRYFEPSLAPQIQQIILKCLERKPADRYDSAAALAEDLRNHQDLPITGRGLDRKKKYHFFSFLLPDPSFPAPSPPAHRTAEHKKYHILGAIVDDDNSNLVVEGIRKRALMHDARVTLLTVIEEEDDSHFRRYGLEVEGERFRSRLEQYIQRFRRYNIDPTIRLIPGEAAETILSVAKNISADLIVIGPSRKPGLFGDSVVKNVTAGSTVKVLVAEPETSVFAWSKQGLSPVALTREQVLDIDLFLIDAWYHHVNWLADMALILLKDPESTPDLDPGHCFVGKWLAELRSNPPWVQTAEILEPVHNEVHAMAEKLKACANSGDLQCMKKLYRENILPLSCALRDSLIEAGRLIRLQSGHTESGQAPLLVNHACPIYSEEMPCGGPLLQLQTIKQYLDNRIAAALPRTTGNKASITGTEK